jgi:integration host factor subunit alpha
MTETTVTRADLSEAVYQEVGLSRNDSAALVETVLNEIVDALTRGQTVKISSFGSFSVRQKGKRVGRNPKTGEEVPILPRKVLVFRASHVLKNKINRALSKATGGRANLAAPASAAAEPKA